jgi:hypothetical protein
MKKSLIVGIALAASALTACSSGTDTATSTSTTSATSAGTSTSVTASDTASADDTTAEGTADESAGESAGGSATGEPVVLDEQSTAWFSTFCGSVTSIQEKSQGMQSMQPDPAAAPAEQQTLLAAGVTDFGNTFKTAASDLGALPPATIEGGEELATGATTAFNQIGDAMIAAAEKYAATPVTDQASLQSASAALGTEVQSAAAGIQESMAPMQSILTPELGAAVEQIPGCEGIASS